MPTRANERCPALAPLEELAETRSELAFAEFGGKAGGLARLIATGLPVLPGFALARRAFVDATSPLRENVFEGAHPAPDPGADAPAGPQPETEAPAGRDRALEEAKAAVAEAPLREELARAIESRAAALGERVIVRSSATLEDAPGLAAPGVFATVEDVPPKRAPAAVARVWASALAPAAWTYLEARDVDPRSAEMGVVIQRQLAPDRAGVVYTRSPAGLEGRGGASEEAPRDRSEVLIEVRAGGRKTWARGSRDGSQAQLGPDCPLGEAELLRLLQLCASAETAIGAGAQGADIEYAIEGETIWLLQARPLATSAPAEPAPPPSIFSPLAAIDAEVVWEWDAPHNPDPLSPAQIGLVERVDGLGTLPNRLAVAGGYLYTAPARRAEKRADRGRSNTRSAAGANAAGAHGAAQSPGRVEAECAGERADPGAPAGDERADPGAPAGDGRADPGAPAGDEDLQRAFSERIAPAIERALAPAETPDADLETCLRAYGEVAHLYFAEHSPAVSRARRRLPATLSELDVGEDPEELAGELVLGASRDGALSLVGADPAGRIDPDRAAERLAPMAPSWDVATPTYGESPAWMAARIAALAAPPPGTERNALTERAEARADAIRARIRARGDAERFERALATGRDAARIAELDDRLFFRAQAAVRGALLRLAAQWNLAGGDELFWIPLTEVAERAAHGRPIPAAEAAERAAEARELAAERAAYHMPVAVVGGRPAVPPTRSEPGRWVGWGTGGRARGRAALLAGEPSARASDLEGRVAVASAVTPASVIALYGASALVAEHGGPLSHAAALARELGIPCVLGCARATREISEGERLYVDGHAGVAIALDRGATRRGGTRRETVGREAAGGEGADSDTQRE